MCDDDDDFACFDFACYCFCDWCCNCCRYRRCICCDCNPQNFCSGGNFPIKCINRDYSDSGCCWCSCFNDDNRKCCCWGYDGGVQQNNAPGRENKSYCWRSSFSSSTSDDDDDNDEDKDDDNVSKKEHDVKIESKRNKTTKKKNKCGYCGKQNPRNSKCSKCHRWPFKPSPSDHGIPSMVAPVTQQILPLGER